MAANRERELAKLSAEELVQHLRFSCPCLEAEYDAAARVLAERERRAAETEQRLQAALSQVAALRRNLGHNREEKFLAEADLNLRAAFVEIDELTKSFAADAPVCTEQLAVAGVGAGAHLELALVRVSVLREMNGAAPSFKPPQQDVAVEVEEVTLNMGTAMKMEMHGSAPSVEPPQLDAAEAEESNMGTAIEMEMHGVVVPPIEALPPQDVAETEETAAAHMETAMDISAPDHDPAPVLDLPLQEVEDKPAVVGEGQEGDAPPHSVVDADAEETAQIAVDIADAAEASSLAQVLLQLKEDQVPCSPGMDIDIIDLVDTGSDEDGDEEYTIAPPRKRQQPSRVAKNKGTNKRGRQSKAPCQNKPSSPAAENNFRCWLYTRVPSSSPPASGAGSRSASPVPPPSIVEGPPLFLEHCTRKRPWIRRSLFTEWLMSNGDQNGGVSENGQGSFVPLGAQPPSSPVPASTTTEQVSPGMSSSKSTCASVLHSTKLRRTLFPPTLTMRWRSHESMINTFMGNLELCMHALCALYRNKKLIVESSKGGQSSFNTPLNTSQAYRATKLAEFLSGGDPKGLVWKTKQDLVSKDATAPSFLEEVVILCSKELFDIYKKKEDLFFC